mmetsp:Transcript_3775/g.9757  ORF Transcript_3775/g.9757 Transcript_3775/m.9757 type:complete len:292 (-) Transcript_3775:189-1064(-)
MPPTSHETKTRLFMDPSIGGELILLKAAEKTAAKLAEKSMMDARQICSTSLGGRMDSPQWCTTPKYRLGPSCCSARLGPIVKSLSSVSSANDLLLLPNRLCMSGLFPLKVLFRCMRRCLKSCPIWAAGRDTLEAIFVSCHLRRRSSMPQFAFHETWPNSSSGRSTSTASARCSPRTCCNKAIAVTSSTPAGTSTTSVCWRCKPPPDVHQSALPMVGWEVSSSSRSVVICRLKRCAVFGSPSAMQRKPVSANLRTFHTANVFHGAVRPCNGRIPGSKACPSSTGPTTSVSFV